MELKDIKDLMRSFDKSGITKLKIKDSEFSIEMQKGATEIVAPLPPSPAPSSIAPPVAVVSHESSEPQAKPVAVEEVKTINSPMVGTFYKAPSPGSAPFVEVGSVVTKGQTVAIVEAMKIMNEIESEFDCKIVKILVEDGQPVEYGMALFEVEV